MQIHERFLFLALSIICTVRSNVKTGVNVVTSRALVIGLRPFFHPLRYLWYGLEVSFQRRQLRITRQLALNAQHWHSAEHMSSSNVSPHYLKIQNYALDKARYHKRLKL